MPIVRLVRSLVVPPTPGPAPDGICSVCFSAEDGHADRVWRLAQAVRDAGDLGLLGAGLLGELASRPGRQVEAWLAESAPEQEDSDLLGLVSLVAGRSARGQRISIAWLLVHPEARRRGIGRLLVGQACRRAHAWGGSELQVECRADWQGAIAFWEAMGFATLGGEADRVGPGRRHGPLVKRVGWRGWSPVTA
jgi:ribosomal protein S18 acetylase RimI-like enzyme